MGTLPFASARHTCEPTNYLPYLGSPQHLGRKKNWQWPLNARGAGGPTFGHNGYITPVVLGKSKMVN